MFSLFLFPGIFSPEIHLSDCLCIHKDTIISLYRIMGGSGGKRLLLGYVVLVLLPAEEFAELQCWLLLSLVPTIPPNPSEPFSVVSLCVLMHVIVSVQSFGLTPCCIPGGFLLAQSTCSTGFSWIQALHSACEFSPFSWYSGHFP